LFELHADTQKEKEKKGGKSDNKQKESRTWQPEGLHNAQQRKRGKI
jgi:hypothetical protein